LCGEGVPGCGMDGRTYPGDAVHYCIYCGSAGALRSICRPHHHVRGLCVHRPTWSMQFGTHMGYKLAYVSFPWAGDPDAEYVPAPKEWRRTSWPPREYVEWKECA